MFLLVALLIVGLQFSFINLHNISADLSLMFHTTCLRFSPVGPWQPLYSATVCGSNLKSAEFVFYLKKFGLLHLIVVSGAHLLFLERLMSLVKLRSKLLIYPILVLFSLISLFQPPIVRGLLGLALSDINVRFRLFWSPAQIVFLSGLMSWLLFPSWIESISFLLSWSCSLALCLVSDTKGIKREVIIYCFISLFLLPLQTPHPISILMNLLVAPAIGFILFPASLVAFVCPPLVMVTDSLWSVLFSSLELMNPHIDGLSLHHPTPLLTLWLLLWSTHGYWEWRHRKKQHEIFARKKE
jgi:predicted membrane metal-binding protein